MAILAGIAITPRSSTYIATSRLYVGSRTIDLDPTSQDVSGNRAAGLGFLANTFANMLQSRTVAEQAVALSGVPLTVEEADAAITAFAEPATALITVRVSDSDPAVAADLANGVADSFVDFLQAQESQLALPDDADAPAPVSVYEHAVLPTTPQPSNLFRNLVLATMFGILVAVGIVVLLEYLDLTIKSADDAQHRLQLPVLGAIPLDSRLVRG